MALAVVVAAVAGVDWERVSVRRGHEEGERLTRVVGEQSRGRGLAEEDGEGGDDSDGELVHIVGWKRRRRVVSCGSERRLADEDESQRRWAYIPPIRPSIRAELGLSDDALPL